MVQQFARKEKKSSMALRAGSVEAGMMWNAAPAVWSAALSTYDACLAEIAPGKALKIRSLKPIDSWWRTSLPNLLKKEGKLTKEQMKKVMVWKLGRGTWRPLMAVLDRNSEAAVEEATQAALQPKLDVQTAITELTVSVVSHSERGVPIG